MMIDARSLPRLFTLAALLTAASASAQVNCAGTSIGEIPLTDLGAGTYRSFEGGLYPGGVNSMPASHLQAGLQIAQSEVVPRDANGAPDPNGRIVLLSIGMSNTAQEFSRFVQLSNADPNRSTSVVVVDGAQSGQDARRVADPNAGFWNNVDARLAQAGVTPAQVQAVWLKEAVSHPTLPFPAHAEELRDLLLAIVQNIKARYSNARLCYLSSRIYAGYAPPTSQNPEHYAYESGFSVKWLIERQLQGDPAINFDPNVGAVNAPWIAWGPYLWADGLTPRGGDGLTWLCSDYASDGTHPGMTGQDKVAQMLDGHFHSDPTATVWYEGQGGGGAPAAVFPYGSGCAGVSGIPDHRANGTPFIGNLNFRFGILRGAPNAATAMMMSFGSASIPLAGSCSLLIDPSQSLPSLNQATGSNGRTSHTLAIPSDPGLIGLSLYVQTVVVDPAGTPFLALPGLAMTPGSEWRIGV